ncbi:hypothetical protein [Salinigranum halophilum]|uniref:hypothetical protein n=1 Tax=Salinigranum halophilum TaxID=2565931 RepID=UPI0010A7F40C|nr:hypothetical protein [Salinigranum halophilum]
MERSAPSRNRIMRGLLLFFSFSAAVAAVWIGRGMDDNALALSIAAVGVAVAVITTGPFGVATYYLGAVATGDEMTPIGIVLLGLASFFLLLVETPSGARVKTGVLLIPLMTLFGIGIDFSRAVWGPVITVFLLLGLLGTGIYVFRRLTIARLGLTTGERSHE